MTRRYGKPNTDPDRVERGYSAKKVDPHSLPKPRDTGPSSTTPPSTGASGSDPDKEA